MLMFAEPAEDSPGIIVRRGEVDGAGEAAFQVIDAGERFFDVVAVDQHGRGAEGFFMQCRLTNGIFCRRREK